MMTTTTTWTLDNTIGALQIGVIFAIFLFGIITLQTYLYFRRFSASDPWMLKALVGVVWILELLHTIGICYELYHSTITLFGQPQRLFRFPILGGITLVGGLITLITQCFFSLRVWRALPNPYSYIGVFCMAIAVAHWVGSIVLSARLLIAPTMGAFKWYWLVTCLLVASVVVDLIITVSMLYYLINQRKNALKRVARLLDQLVAYTIRTGVLTSIIALGVAICFQVMSSNLIWLALYTFLAKLYSNSLLSALNERQHLRRRMVHGSSFNFKTETGGTRGHRPRCRVSSRVIDIRAKTSSDSSSQNNNQRYFAPPSENENPHEIEEI